MAKVEVYEMLGFVGDKGAKVAAHNAMPGWAFAFVELYHLLEASFEEKRE